MRHSINPTKHLSTQELENLKTTLEDHKKSSPRDVALLTAALYTGARASEVLAIRFEDLSPSRKSIFIRGLKGSNDREIFVRPWVFKLIFEASGCREGRVFDLSYIRFYQIWLMYRPAKKKLHSLRHTFAIEIYRRTKDIRLVQVALGHRNLLHTMVYSQYVHSTEELRRARL